MTGRGITVLGAVLAVQLAFAGAAQAQYYGYFGPTPADIIAMNSAPSDLACQKGESVPASQVNIQLQQSQPVMTYYWGAAMAGGSPVEAFNLDKYTSWVSGTTKFDKKTIGSIKDPFAVDGNILGTKPLGFKVAGDGGSALGQWQVRNAAGELVGTYQAMFRYKKGSWKLSSLELIDRQTWVEPVQQYCHKPGDVIGYRLKNAQEGVNFAEARLGPARQEEASARAAAEKAKALADADPGNAGKQEAARQAAAKLTAAANTAQAYQSMVDKNRADLAKVQADQAAMEQARTAGKAALAPQP